MSDYLATLAAGVQALADEMRDEIDREIAEGAEVSAVDALAEIVRGGRRKARLAAEHRRKCQQAFRRPSRRCGRGSPPRKKWGALR